MYELAEEEIGDDIWDKFEVWERLKSIDEKAARRAWRDYGLSKYMDIKEEFLPQIEQALIRIGAALPQSIPESYRDGRIPEQGFRPNDENEEWIREQMFQYVGEGVSIDAIDPGPQILLSQLLQQPGGPELVRLLYDTEPLPEAAAGRLDELGILSYVQQMFNK